METRQLRDLTVSAIGMGCMAFSHGYGKIPEESYSIEAIRLGLDLGCTFFDTAEVYSPNLEGLGHNELIVGKALYGHRHEIILATKLFVATEEVAAQNSVAKVVRNHLLNSLKRLQTEYVDLYYLHRVNPDVSVDEIAAAMGDLIQEGLIRGWGLSAISLATLSRVHAITPVTAVQNLYNILERDCEKEIIPFCLNNNIGVVPFSPVGSGFLSGKITSQTTFEKVDDVRNWVPQLSKEHIKANQPILDVLNRFSTAKGATNAQIALAWMLHKYPNVVPIPGSKNKERIQENFAASTVQFTKEEFASLEAELGKCTVHGHRGCVEEGASPKEVIAKHEKARAT